MSENTPAEVGTDVVVSSASSARDVVAALKSGDVSVFSSFTDASQAGRLAVLRALTNTEPLDEHMGEPIDLTNFVVQVVQVSDESTGTTVDAPRVILVDAEGRSYAAVSNGILRALENLVGILGQPHTWEGPVTVTAVQEKTRKGYRVFTLKVV